MKWQRILIFLLVCLMLGGCGPEAPVETAAPSLFREFSLGMTPEELFSHLEKANLSLEMPDYDAFPLPEDVPDAVADGRIYNMTDLSFYYKVEGRAIWFAFSYEGALIGISCADSSVSTPMGLAVGDSLEDAKRMYDNDYLEEREGYSVLQYKTKNGYFNVFYEENTVTRWSMNRYSNINND